MLTILIATLNSRKTKLEALGGEILRQIDLLPKRLQKKISLTYCPDDGQMTIGAKRQWLLNSCKTEYCVFIDDDDWIAETYIADIVEALKQKPDCVGFRGSIITNGVTKENWVISSRYKAWSKSAKDGYVRHTNHLTPVRTEIALKAGFNSKKHGEDYDYSMALKPHLKTEVFIDKYLYQYNYQSVK